MKLSNRQKQLESEHVERVWYFQAGYRTTVAVARLKNGFEVVGSYVSQSQMDFDSETSKQHALIDALDKVQDLLDFERQQKQYNEVRKQLEDEEIQRTLRKMEREATPGSPDAKERLNDMLFLELMDLDGHAVFVEYQAPEEVVDSAIGFRGMLERAIQRFSPARKRREV